MKLFMHPASPPSRAVLLFAAESGIRLDMQLVDLMTGAHLQPSYLAINPNGLVPVLEDGDFRLTESSAILKYLADSSGSGAYPSDLKERAKVNEAMDWLVANFYRDFGFNLIYPQLFAHHHRSSEGATRATVEWGLRQAQRWLSVLDRHMIGPHSRFICLNRLTLADFLGAALVTLGDIIRYDLAGYPNITRWLHEMKSLPSWDEVNKEFYGMVNAFKSQTLVAA